MAKDKGSYRPLVYICSRYAGDVEENTARTREFSRFCLEQGNIPLAPQLMFPQFMDDQDPEERGLAISMDMVLMGKCGECWVLVVIYHMNGERGRKMERQDRERKEKLANAALKRLSQLSNDDSEFLREVCGRSSYKCARWYWDTGRIEDNVNFT